MLICLAQLCIHMLLFHSESPESFVLSMLTHLFSLESDAPVKQTATCRCLHGGSMPPDPLKLSCSRPHQISPSVWQYLQ